MEDDQEDVQESCSKWTDIRHLCSNFEGYLAVIWQEGVQQCVNGYKHVESEK